MKNPKRGETPLKDYPIIDDLLIECLKRDYPNQLPKDYVDKYELGVLIGQQQIIDRLITEKMYQEND